MLLPKIRTHKNKLNEKEDHISTPHWMMEGALVAASSPLALEQVIQKWTAQRPIGLTAVCYVLKVPLRYRFGRQ